MRVRGVFYRVHDPRHSWSSLSGEGARLHGGRWNPLGTPAFYLGATLDGVFNEVSHGFANRIEPSMIVSYDVDCDDIVDLCDAGERERLAVREEDMACAWGSFMLRGETPPSWRIADALIANGAAGILTPSFANGAQPEHVNLVLWHWADDGPHRVTVYDPNDRLPKDDQSWKE